MSRSALRVLKNPRYAALAVGVSVVTFCIAVLLPNFQLIASVWRDTSVALPTKIQLVIQLLGSIGTNLSVLSALLTILTALLLGVNVSMIICYLRQARQCVSGASIGTASTGLFAGIVGVGCAACGSLVVSMFVPVVVAGSTMALLPLEGKEFSILSIALLVVSIGMLSQRVSRANACAVSPESITG